MMLESGILARNILLITNATCITDDVANMLAEKHVSVQVSLNGSRAELHDSICGKGNFERTMAGLQRLLSKHANMVIVRNMMNKQNMNDNWDILSLKRKLQSVPLSLYIIRDEIFNQPYRALLERYQLGISLV